MRDGVDNYSGVIWVDVKSDEISKWQAWCKKVVLDGMEGAYFQRPATHWAC